MTGITNQLDIQEEFKLKYVEACQGFASNEEIRIAILYLNTQPGGILAYREAKKLHSAIEHIQRMKEKGHLEITGLPRDYTYEELFDLLVINSDCLEDDLKRAIEECQSNGFYPCPSECIETIESLKGIDGLEKDLVKEKQKTEEQRVKAEEERVKAEKLTLSIDALKQQLEQEKRALRQQLEQANQQIRQHEFSMLQMRLQHEEVLREKNHTIRQLREDRECPEGEWEKKYKKIEHEKEELIKFKCQMCATQFVDVIFLPCNHAVSCMECVPKLGNKCPVCREVINKSCKLFIQWK